jgi:hypothetical protein
MYLAHAGTIVLYVTAEESTHVALLALLDVLDVSANEPSHGSGVSCEPGVEPLDENVDRVLTSDAVDNSVDDFINIINLYHVQFSFVNLEYHIDSMARN